jgi:hypothetical protein
MNEDIAFWKGQKVKEMDAPELRTALAELYREHERLKWAHYRVVGGTGQKTGAADNIRAKKGAGAIMQRGM